MGKEFDGKVALVTGAASGIGRATALAFAKQGAKVVIADVDVEGGEATRRMILDKGGSAIFVRADISKAAEVQAMVDKAVETYGRLDCAHNNAGIDSPTGPLIDIAEQSFDRLYNINLKGTWLSMKYEVPQMMKQGGGSIVNTSSITALIAVPGFAAYGATKAGIVAITRTAALELAKAGIRVNCVCPGGIDTPMAQSHGTTKTTLSVPLGRRGEPEEIAEAVVWLCSNSASYVVGHALTIDGGFIIQ